MRRSIGVLVVAVVGMAVMLTSGSRRSDADDTLVGAYPWKAIYVTYIPLRDIASVLDDAKAYTVLVATPGGGAPQLLKQFLARNSGPNIREGVAFLELDLVQFKAGYKKASDTGLTITETGWDAAQVKAVAQLCHTLATHLAPIQQIQAAIKAGTLDLLRGWSAIKTTQADILVPAARRAEIVHYFRGLIDAKAGELGRLKASEPVTYEEITRFKAAYDGSKTQFQGQLIANQLPADIKTRGEVEDYLGDKRAGWDGFLKKYDTAVMHDVKKATSPEGK